MASDYGQRFGGQHHAFSGSTVWSGTPPGREMSAYHPIGIPYTPVTAHHGAAKIAHGPVGPPVPGFSGGVMPTSVSGEFMRIAKPVPNHPEKPGISPVQHLQSGLHEPSKGHFHIGVSVRLKHMCSPEGQMYNGVVGDIVGNRVEDGYNGLPEHVFDVRCPWRDPTTVTKGTLQDKKHGRVPCSHETAQWAEENRDLLLGKNLKLPSLTGFPGSLHHNTPYIYFTGLPADKIELVEDDSDTFIQHMVSHNETQAVYGHGTPQYLSAQAPRGHPGQHYSQGHHAAPSMHAGYPRYPAH